MKSPIMFRCSIIAKRLSSVLFGIGLLFSAVSAVADCESGKGITSNDISRIAGNGDTLWMLTWDDARSQYSLNAIIHGGDTSKLHQDKYWGAYNLGCINSEINDLAFGGGKAVICFDTLKWRQENPVLFLSYDGNSIKQQRVNFNWSSDLKDSLKYHFAAVEAAWANNAFYFACQDGGLVKWDQQNKTGSAFLPGKSSSIPVHGFTVSASEPDTRKRVIGVEQYENNVIVLTPEKIWRFSTIDSSWDSSISSIISNSGFKFKEFEAVYPKPDGEGTFYSRIRVKKSVNETWKDTTILAKYSKSKNRWYSMLERPVYDVEFGPGDYIFILGEDAVTAYRDTLGDSVVTSTPVINSSKFQNWITQNFTIGSLVYTDLLYLPLTDSTGYFWVASSEGIFLAKWQFPLKSSMDFIQIRRAPQIESGLKQTYARPGLLVQDVYGEESRTVFIYNLSKDANVSIRVYDYNMDLVNTIINKKFRRAGSNGGQHGRSTVESEDWWDGRNSAGKMVAPGVYYYKITTDIGERAFGKVVVAK